MQEKKPHEHEGILKMEFIVLSKRVSHEKLR